MKSAGHQARIAAAAACISLLVGADTVCDLITDRSAISQAARRRQHRNFYYVVSFAQERSPAEMNPCQLQVARGVMCHVHAEGTDRDARAVSRGKLARLQALCAALVTFSIIDADVSCR
jgi:hypothetical protein